MTTDTTRRRLDLRDDTGTTLLELVVAMGLLTVFMGIFSASVFMMTRASTEVQAISQAVDQGNTAFLNLEKTVRYSTGISTPARSTTGIWHVELGSRDQGDGSGSDLCTQLRVSSSGQLQSRTWTVSGETYATGSLSAWKVLASSVTNGTAAAGAADRPFVLPAASDAAASPYQRLTVLLVTTGGPVGNVTTHRTLSTFTALNSSSDSSAPVCNQVEVTA